MQKEFFCKRGHFLHEDCKIVVTDATFLRVPITERA